ncbi:MAG: DHHA1 domain-containing protein [Leptospirillia bacterium]
MTSEPSDNSNRLILYHDDCIDGFGAAWAAWTRLGDAAEYRPVTHGHPPPDVSGRDVTIVDFSYKRDVLLGMADAARSLEVVDHHKSARSDLAGLDFCIFDMGKSGAVLSWEHFNPDTPVPEILLYVQDKDLWTWKLPKAAEITAALRGYPFEFSRWAAWADAWETARPALETEGDAIIRFQKQVVAGVINGAEEITVGGYKVMAACTPILQSEVAGQLAEGRPFGLAWFEANGKRYYSLRSREGGIDVADFAQRFGGGGHARAAGFAVDAAGYPGVVDTPD